MHNVVFLILRRMRMPLALLIAVYATATLGFVLIPGQNPQGGVYRMDFFHAFYFVSFMGSTIGFGEIPYPFTGAQRLWTLGTIYATVVCWLYTIGALVNALQDPALRTAITHNTFVRRVRRIVDPFYLVCGYGDTGTKLVRALDSRGLACVVIDADEARINDLELDDFYSVVPAVCADATRSDVLLVAGLKHRRCAGVISITQHDDVNLKVAITSKLLNPELPVICRAEHSDTDKNLASFDTDHIINPFEAFAEYLGTALSSPGRYLLHQWLTSAPHTPLAEPVFPAIGHWILCGYGRFGKAVEKCLQYHGGSATVIEIDPASPDIPTTAITARGTEADTLAQAGIDTAVGLVAGTDNDTNNLSIVMTARSLNPDLFVVARQNHAGNSLIFDAAHPDMVAEHSHLIASRILSIITTPLTSEFLVLVRRQDNTWANELVSRLAAIIDDEMPDAWAVRIKRSQSPALFKAIDDGLEVRLGHLNTDPDDRRRPLRAIPLLLRRRAETILLPGPDERLEAFDRILFCGVPGAARRLEQTRYSLATVHYLATGQSLARTLLGRRLNART